MHIAPALNHINLVTHDMDRRIRFYGDVLGFKPGYRPPFPGAGTWLYLGESALIHLVRSDAPVRNEDPAVNHFTLAGEGLVDFLEHLRGLDVSYNVRVAPEMELHQVEVFDPDGNMYEVLFQGAEAVGVDIAPYKCSHRL